MNQTLTDNGASFATERHELRRDHRQREVVDSAVALQQQRGSVVALEFLRSRHVGSDVIQRVLLVPGRMRGASP